MLTARHYLGIVAVMLLACLECSAKAETARVDAGAGPALRVLCPKRVGLAPVFDREAKRYGIPAALLVAVARVESHCNPSAIGLRGERGLFQIKPGTRADGGVSPARLHKPEVNAELAAAHLARCLLLCGDWAGALGVYSGRRTCKAGRASGYARRVLGFWDEVKGERRS